MSRPCDPKVTEAVALVVQGMRIRDAAQLCGVGENAVGKRYRNLPRPRGMSPEGAAAIAAANKARAGDARIAERKRRAFAKNLVKKAGLPIWRKHIDQVIALRDQGLNRTRLMKALLAETGAPAHVA